MIITYAIIVRNGEKFIERLIISLIDQNIPSDNFKIIIVDGMSTDKTVEVAKKILLYRKINFNIIENKHQSLASGWNLAIKNTNSEFIIRPDVHSELCTGYIKNGIEKLKNQPNVIAIGGVLITKSETKTGELISKVLSNPIGVGPSLFRIGLKKDVFSDTVVYGVYRTNIFKKIGYFNENLARNQDIDLHNRLKKQGYKMITSPSLKAVYYSRSSVKKFLNQGYDNGFWVGKGYGNFRHLIPMLFFLSLVLLSIINFKLTLLLLFIYMISVLLSFIYYSKLSNPLNLVKVLILTFLLHINYGVGTIMGFLENKNEKNF